MKHAPLSILTLTLALGAPLRAQVDPEADRLITRGANSLKRGEVEAAIRDFSRAIQLDAAVGRAWRLRGIAYLAADEHDKAISDLTEALRLNAKDLAAVQFRGRARLAGGDAAGAERDFGSVITVDPKSAAAHLDRARARAALQQPSAAIDDLTAAIALDGRLADAFIERGALHALLGRFRQAADDQTKALELDPGAAEAWYNRGQAHFALGEYEAAERDFGALIRLAPRDATAFLMRAMSRFRGGELLGAAADLEVVLELDPKRLDAYVARANIRAAVGDVDGALGDYSRALALQPDAASLFAQRGLFHFSRRQWDQAIEDLQRFAELTQGTRQCDYAQLWLWLGRARQGKAAAADTQLRSYLTARGDVADAWFARLAAFLLDDLTEADLLLLAAAADGDRRSLRLVQALYFSGGKRLIHADPNSAIRAWRKCIGEGGPDQAEVQAAFVDLRQVLLGMRIANVDDATRRKLSLGAAVGFVIDRVSPGGPAARAGVREGDVLLKINGADATAGMVRRIAQRSQPGDELTLAIVRDGILTLKLVVAKWDDAP